MYGLLAELALFASQDSLKNLWTLYYILIRYKVRIAPQDVLPENLQLRIL